MESHTHQTDPINHVVDILLSVNQKVEAERLEKQRQDLDKIFQKLCDERVQDFNTILFSVRPLEHSLNELSVHVEGLQKSSKIIKEELMSQTNLQNFRQLEFKSYYYQEMIEGLQVFEKIERLIEGVEFLQSQNNLLSAAIEFESLKKYVYQSDVKQLLQDFGIFEQLRKRVIEKQRYLLDQITSNIMDIIFVKSQTTCLRKLEMISQFLDSKIMTLSEDQKILEYVSKEISDLKKIQDAFQKIHIKDFECAQKANELISQSQLSSDEVVTTGLICLQKDYIKAIEDQNVSYLALLIIAYKKISEKSLQDFLRAQMDLKMQNLVQKLIETLIAVKKQKNSLKSHHVHNDTVITELLQINGQELRSITQTIQVLFFYFQSNLNYFLIIDKLDATQQAESVSIDYVNIFFYYFKMIIQILFDHDRRIKEFNNKNGINPEPIQVNKKPVVEKNLRFSFRNREEMESFLTDSVKQKLDFYKQLEDMVIPHLFQKNISFVMTMGNRLMTMIEGVVDMVDTNLSTQNSKDNKYQIQAFKGWMRRFIVTNYEIYLDFYKQHSEFIAQKYFNKSINSQNLYKTGLADDKFIPSQSMTLQNVLTDLRGSMIQMSKASIIGKLSAQKRADDDSLWIIFDYVKSFSYISQLAVERIPLDENKKQDQAQFRQDILESVNKVMKKVYDKMSQIVTLCFNNSHKDNFFHSKLYALERETYYFKGLVKREESKKDKNGTEGIEDQEFLYKPKLAIQNELLSNSMTTLTLLLQIYSKLNDIALNEFNACYQFITNQKIWEQLLQENQKKDFQRHYEQIQNLVFDILIFLRCELTARCFNYMREMTKTDFVGITSSSQRVEPFAQSLIRDVKILNNFMSQFLGQVEVFYLLAHLQKFVFRLYGYYIRFIKRQQVDEIGFQRLKTSLLQIKVDFEMIVPKLLSIPGESSHKLQKIRDDMKLDIAREYEKTIYILQFLVCDEKEIPLRIKENDFGLTEQDFGFLLNIQQNYFAQNSFNSQ